MHNNRYTFIYAIGISILTAIILVFTSETLKPKQLANVALDNKANILKSVGINTSDKKSIEESYNKNIKAVVVNAKGEVLANVNVGNIDIKKELDKDLADRQLPLYVYSGEGTYYIVPLRGTGLWGPIWGYISLKDDFNTVHGAFFDHKGETPGLGAEIAELPFQQQFMGKKIMDEQNSFVSVNVLKTSEKSDLKTENRVDAISGGTITSVGTDNMLKTCIEPYLAYFQTIKSEK